MVDFSDGDARRYDVLLVATGGKPEVPSALKMDSPMIRIVRFLERRHRHQGAGGPHRAPRWCTALVTWRSKACRALRKAKKEVVWIKPDTPRYGYPIAGELEASILDDVRNRGTRIKDGDDIVEVRETGAASLLVRNAQRRRDPLFPGRCRTERIPFVGFLAGSGVGVRTGIVVDEFLRTSLPDVYAAGDCAEFTDKASGTSRINFGWRSAIRQGQLAAENMAGGKSGSAGTRRDYFWALFGFSLLDRAKK